MPYFPYSRQSKKKHHRDAITGKLHANLLKAAGVDHIITIDLHASQMIGFFKVPVDNLVSEPIIARFIKTAVPDWRKAVVVSKNAGGSKRVTSLSDKLGLPFGIITTRRRRPHMSPGTNDEDSMMNSMLYESPSADGVNGINGQLRRMPMLDDGIDDRLIDRVDHAEHRPNERGSPGSPTSARQGWASRLLNGNPVVPPSPLQQSTRAGSISESPPPANSRLPRAQTAPAGPVPPQEDGFGENGDGVSSPTGHCPTVLTNV